MVLLTEGTDTAVHLLLSLRSLGLMKFQEKALAAAVQSVKRPELRSLKEVQLN